LKTKHTLLLETRPKGYWRRASGTSQMPCLAFVETLEKSKSARLWLLCEKNKKKEDTVTPLTVNDIGGHQIQPLREEGKRRGAPVSWRTREEHDTPTLTTGPARRPTRPTCRRCCRPCTPPLHGPYSSRRRTVEPARHAVTPIGPARRVAAPWALRVAPPRSWPYASLVLQAPTTTPLLEERKSEYKRRNWRRERIGVREKKLEKRKWVKWVREKLTELMPMRETREEKVSTGEGNGAHANERN
jgi:hypothetical protein